MFYHPAIGCGLVGNPFTQGANHLDFEYKCTFVVDEFTDPKDLKIAQGAIFHMLNALINIDIDYLREHPEVPNLYEATGPTGLPLFYEADDRVHVGEFWKSIPSVLKRGKADCKDFVAWRIAELQVRHGIKAEPVLQWKRFEDGSQLYHVQVKYPNGDIEDPSRILGMKD